MKTKKSLQGLLVRMSERDVQLQFQFTARVIVLSMDDTVAFLGEVVMYTKHGRNILTTESQEEMAKVTDMLIERGKEYVGQGGILEAGSVAFAIVLAIKPRMADVAMTGLCYSKSLLKLLNCCTRSI